MNTELVVANFALVVVTIGLVIVTWLYVRHTKRLADDTKRMADIVVREHELRISPIIELTGSGGFSPSGEGFGRRQEIVNRGFYQVTLQKIGFDWQYIEHKGIGDSIIQDIDIDKILPAGKSKEIELSFSDDALQRDEYPKSKECKGAHIGRLVEGKIWVTCLSITGEIHKVEKKIDRVS